MNINVQRGIVPLKISRKEKIKNLFKKSKKEIIVYDWKISNLEIDESIEDFHLFCISIVRDLVRKDFKTNEKGKITYELMNDIENEETINYLNILSDTIKIEKKKIKK